MLDPPFRRLLEFAGPLELNDDALHKLLRGPDSLRVDGLHARAFGFSLASQLLQGHPPENSFQLGREAIAAAAWGLRQIGWFDRLGVLWTPSERAVPGTRGPVLLGISRAPTQPGLELGFAGLLAGRVGRPVQVDVSSVYWWQLEVGPCGDHPRTLRSAQPMSE